MARNGNIMNWLIVPSADLLRCRLQVSTLRLEATLLGCFGAGLSLTMSLVPALFLWRVFLGQGCCPLQYSEGAEPPFVSLTLGFSFLPCSPEAGSG